MAVPYVLTYSLKDTPEDILNTRENASDALRAANALRKTLVDDGTVESKGDVKVLEIKAGY